MSSPKHLWSGDWERESPELKSPPPPRVIARPVSPPDSAKWPPRDPTPGRSRRFTALVVAAVVVVLAAVGVTLAATLSDGSSSTQRSAQRQTQNLFGNSGGNSLQPTPPATTTPAQSTTTPQSQTPQSSEGPGGSQVTAGPSYNWLGMSIADIGSGVAVETVTIGGDADAAGVNPGDVIEQINTTSVSSISQLQAALKNLKIGQSFQIIVDRGSTPVTLTATLTGRPTHS